jgi:hypothetical protein
MVQIIRDAIISQKKQANGAIMAKSIEHAALLKNVESVLLDMDGVLYVGNHGLPGVQEMLDYLDASGRNLLCVTNK